MGEGCGYWFLKQQQFNWLSSNVKPSVAPLIGQQTVNCDSGAGFVSAGGKFPLNSQLPLRVGQVNLSNHGSNPVSDFQQGAMPGQNLLRELLPANTLGHCPKNVNSNAGSPKRFLVFDHSGDQTTLVFSSAFGMPAQCPGTWSGKPSLAFNLNEEIPKSKKIHNLCSEQLSEGLLYGIEADGKSEMREDTEELNALLYSDDEDDDSDYTDEDEVTSTGHSPSTMTSHGEETECNNTEEEVASSFEPSRKRKLFDDSDELIPSRLHYASSKRNRIGHDGDAESSCNGGIDGTDRKTRKEKIRQTVSVLRNMIPGGGGEEGKDAILVIDEAIEFLKSLKLKAKALGLSSP